MLAAVILKSAGLLFISLIIYEIKSPIENVVRSVQRTNAVIGGIIIKSLSSSAVTPIITQNVVQIIKFTIVEYLSEVKSNELP